jgi:thymidylate synthase (FAD)
VNQIKARVIAITMPVDGVDIPDSEGVVSYCARVSAPQNQENFDTAAGLLKYCARNKHWSVFEMATAIVEVEAPRDITRQILRHRSGSFQEFSQRYAEVSSDSFIKRECRLQDQKNRQNSIDLNALESFDEAARLQLAWDVAINEVQDTALYHYKKLLELGVAKECARVLLPEGLTMSRMYISMNLRSWLHYLDVRTGNGTQKEHIEAATAVGIALFPHFRNILGVNK